MNSTILFNKYSDISLWYCNDKETYDKYGRVQSLRADMKRSSQDLIKIGLG